MSYSEFLRVFLPNRSMVSLEYPLEEAYRHYGLKDCYIESKHCALIIEEIYLGLRSSYSEVIQ